MNIFKYRNKNTFVVQSLRAFLVLGTLLLLIKFMQRARKQTARDTEVLRWQNISPEHIETAQRNLTVTQSNIASIRPKIESVCSRNIFLIIVIPTETKRFSERRAIRNSWGKSPNNVSFRKRWLTLFAVGKYTSRFDVFEKELDENNDLFIGDRPSSGDSAELFLDVVRWVLSEFHGCIPKFILKSTVNIYVNPLAVIPWLETIQTDKVYMGRKVRLHEEIAQEQNFQIQEYIDGPVVLFSTTSLTEMIKQEEKHENDRRVFNHVSEAVCLGMLAMRGGVTAQNSKELMALHYNHVRRIPCGYANIFLGSEVKPSGHSTIYKHILKDLNNPSCAGYDLVNRKRTDLR